MPKITIVDFHAEATAEKVSFKGKAPKNKGFFDKIGHFLGLRGYDGEILAGIHAFDHAIHQERLGEQTQQREQPRLHTEYPKRTQRNDKIGCKQCFADIQIGVFLQYQCHDIRAARRGLGHKQQGRADCRQQNGIYQFQKGLIGKGTGHGNQMLQSKRAERKQQAAIDSLDGKSLPQKDKTNDQQQHVDDGQHVAGGQIQRNFGQILICKTRYNDCNTADTACGKSVWNFEKVHTHRGQQNAKIHECKIFEFCFHSDLFRHFYTTVYNAAPQKSRGVTKKRKIRAEPCGSALLLFYL